MPEPVVFLLSILPAALAFKFKHPKRWWIVVANFLLIGSVAGTNVIPSDLTVGVTLADRFNENPLPYLLWFPVLGWSANWFRRRPAMDESTVTKPANDE